MRILGIDPGSNVTGFGVIDSDGRQSRHVASGVIRVRGETLAERLGFIFAAVEQVVADHAPECMAVEEIFMARNAASALKLGQARGAAICAGARAGLPFSAYAATTVKQALVGTGRADKEQVQHMVRLLLGLREAMVTDASDALAVAICHAHTSAMNSRTAGAAAIGGHW